MQDETARAPELDNERAEWVKPALSRLQAGSAELLGGGTDDGSDYS